MTELSATLTPGARKMQVLILQRLASVGQVEAAKAIGVDESTMSRLKSTHLENLAKLLDAIGMKVVPADAKCYKPEHIRALQYFARLGMNVDRDPSFEVRELSFDDPE